MYKYIYRKNKRTYRSVYKKIYILIYKNRIDFEIFEPLIKSNY